MDEGMIADDDIKAIISEAQYQKYSQFTLNQVVDTHKDMAWCPTPDCKFAFIHDPAADGNQLRCPLCKVHYCLECRVEYHEGMTCAEYRVENNVSKDDEKTFKFLKGRKCKQCP